MQLSKELSQTSLGSFELDSDSKESRDVLLNFFKSGILRFFGSVRSVFCSVRSISRPMVVVDRSDFDSNLFRSIFMTTSYRKFKFLIVYS